MLVDMKGFRGGQDCSVDTDRRRIVALGLDVDQLSGAEEVGENNNDEDSLGGLYMAMEVRG